MENIASQQQALFFILMLVEIVLKGFVLWFAARNNQRYWFIALLVINTAGILPGIYLIIYKTNFVKKVRALVKR